MDVFQPGQLAYRQAALDARWSPRGCDGMKITGKHASAIGSAIAFVGGLILFRWGPPQPDFSEGIALGIDGPQVAEQNRRQAALRRQYKWMARFGLGLITAGFFVQALSVIVPD